MNNRGMAQNFLKKIKNNNNLSFALHLLLVCFLRSSQKNEGDR